MLVEFSLKRLYSTMRGKNFQTYSVYITRKCIESRHFYSCPPPHSKFVPKFLSSKLRQREITHPPTYYFFEYLFPPTAERDGGNYDLLYQNSIRKHKDDLEHQAIYIFYDL